MKNREVYEKDPKTHTLLNQGVAKVTSGRSDAELETLRYELVTFVCDGQYAVGLARILSAYLGHLDKPEQPGVWVSGFFGSGKSHLVKMLEHLWVDTVFPDGAKARGLANLPAVINDHFKELTTASRRLGGLHAAAGTLGAGAGESVRLDLLSVVFQSAGLPGDYRTASFVLWLGAEGLEEAVLAAIGPPGPDADAALANFYVSDAIAKAILKQRKDFADKPGDVKLLLEKQFPEKNDVSIEETVAKIKQALGKKGKLPCTLIVLDEVQQYIGDTPQRSRNVKELAEAVQARLGANVMLVGTGQNALTGTPDLKWLMGRFPLAVELQDTDVEQVTREVVLKKKPSAEPAIRTLLEDHSGEIERQLAGTKIAFTTRDRQLLVQDYPILPVRRRFWERVLRAVDKEGTGAQLRNQLSIVFDAVAATAELPLGNVVDAAFIYDSSIQSKTLKSGVLLQEISETIARQRQEDDGELRYRLCALIFLIGQLPREAAADAGIRANPETLADLLVTDLNASSAELRKKVPELLKLLAELGAVMQVDDEYRMQTREGAEWNQVFVEWKNKLLADAGKLASERSQLLKTRCAETLKKSKLVHGVSKTVRKFELCFGAEPPAAESAVPVWIRDGWEVDEKTVLQDARAAGDSAAVVYAFIPRGKPEEVKQSIANCYAAAKTLEVKGTPAGDEGAHARKSMETRQELAEKARESLLADVLNETTVYLAGGDPVNGLLLASKVEEAAKACLDRLYPLFHLADSPAADWKKVYERAKKGDGDALSVVDHQGDAESHPVCKALLDYVGSGKKGAEVRKRFENAPYGWPQDALDAALVVLTGSGHLQAKSGSQLLAKDKLDLKTIAAAEFRVETITLSKVQMIDLRGLFKKLGIGTQPGQEAVDAAKFLDRLLNLAQAAGGECPLPKPPAISHLSDMANRVGNDQLQAIHAKKDQLAGEAAAWQKRQELIAKRLPRWHDLKALLAHAADLPVAVDVQAEVQAIEAQRRLLEEPDAVPAIVNKLTDALRKALKDAHAACATAHEVGLSALEAAGTWQKLTPEQRYEMLSKHGVRQVPPVAVGSAEEVLDTLRKTKVSEWQAIRDALPTRFSGALGSAAKLLEPKAQHISLPTGTIKNDDDLKTWLTTAEERIREKLKEGPVII